MAGSIRVDAPGGAYDIQIQPGLLRALHERPEAYGLKGRLVLVTNTTLAPLYGTALADSLGAQLVTMEDGERYKTLATVADLYRAFIGGGLDRYGTVLALGGGVVGDAVGFAAATYMRGVRLVQIPTSLLAMVDSSVGGKVGVDLPEGKNMVGAFKQPDRVLIDTDVLATLPPLEWRHGMAEVIKHGLLADERLLAGDLHTPDRAAELVERAIKVKVDVVQRDPFEQGVRAHLNLGHTFAHAIEQMTGYAWPHGDAVAVGLVAAVRLSCRLRLCDESLIGRVEGLLAGLDLPRRIGDLDPEALYAAMATDKKWREGRSRFVLLRRVGDPLIMEGVDRQLVLDVLNELRSP